MVMCICIEVVGKEMNLQLHHLVISTQTATFPESSPSVLMIILIFVFGKVKSYFTLSS